MINVADIIVGIYSAIVVASIGVGRAYSWGLFATVREAGRCQITPERIPQYIAGAICLIAIFNTGSAMRFVIGMIYHPWPVADTLLLAVVNVGLALVALCGYYFAMVAWYGGRGYKFGRRFRTAWLIVLLVTSIAGAAAGHLLRLDFATDGAKAPCHDLQRRSD